MQMGKEQYGKAKACLVSCMQEGYSWQVAKAVAGLQISQSSAYRLWRAFRQCGEAALSDKRHGHPSKLRGAARAFLEERCRQAPQTLHPLSRWNCESVLTCASVSARSTVSGRHSESATMPSAPSLEKKPSGQKYRLSEDGILREECSIAGICRRQAHENSPEVLPRHQAFLSS